MTDDIYLKVFEDHLSQIIKTYPDIAVLKRAGKSSDKIVELKSLLKDKTSEVLNKGEHLVQIYKGFLPHSSKLENDVFPLLEYLHFAKSWPKTDLVQMLFKIFEAFLENYKNSVIYTSFVKAIDQFTEELENFKTETIKMFNDNKSNVTKNRVLQCLEKFFTWFKSVTFVNLIMDRNLAAKQFEEYFLNTYKRIDIDQVYKIKDELMLIPYMIVAVIIVMLDNLQELSSTKSFITYESKLAIKELQKAIEALKIFEMAVCFEDIDEKEIIANAMEIYKKIFEKFHESIIEPRLGKKSLKEAFDRFADDPSLFKNQASVHSLTIPMDSINQVFEKMKRRFFVRLICTEAFSFRCFASMVKKLKKEKSLIHNFWVPIYERCHQLCYISENNNLTKYESWSSNSLKLSPIVIYRLYEFGEIFLSIVESLAIFYVIFNFAKDLLLSFIATCVEIVETSEIKEKLNSKFYSAFALYMAAVKNENSTDQIKIRLTQSELEICKSLVEENLMVDASDHYRTVVNPLFELLESLYEFFLKIFYRIITLEKIAHLFKNTVNFSSALIKFVQGSLNIGEVLENFKEENEKVENIFKKVLNLKHSQIEMTYMKAYELTLKLGVTSSQIVNDLNPLCLSYSYAKWLEGKFKEIASDLNDCLDQDKKKAVSLEEETSDSKLVIKRAGQSATFRRASNLMIETRLLLSKMTVSMEEEQV